MRQDWDNVTLGEAVTLQRGFDLSHDEFDGGRFPVVSSGGIIGHHSVAMAHGPGVVIGRTGTLDSVFYLTSDYWPHNTTLWVKDFHGNVPRFIYYFLRGLSLAYMNVGSANPTLNRNHLHELTVRLPRVPYQRAIARVLGSLDDKIELNRRMNQTLEDICRALFKFWFVDFGPVRAKQEGQWKKGESLPGMPADMWDLWPSEFEESEIGEIPRGWKSTSLLEMSKLLSGGTPSTSEPSYWGGGIPWVSGKDVSAAGGSFILKTERDVSEEGVSHSHTSLLPEGTVVITARGTVGALGILAEPMCISQTSYGLKAMDGVPDGFLRFSVENIIDDLKQASYGTIFDTITTKNLKATQVVRPPASILSEFASLVGPLSERALTSLKESATLADIRDSLLPKLLSGQIRVKVDA